jgi:hypothetical protein
MSRSSASLRVSPPIASGISHASKVHHGPGLAKAEPPCSTSDAEQDDRPTQRVIPVGQSDPKPDNTGTIVMSEGAAHVYAPGAKWLGTYPNAVVAQRRLDLFFGRASRRDDRLSRGELRKNGGTDQPDLGPSAAEQGRTSEGGRG